MPGFSSIKESAQQTATAIAAALGVEVAIIGADSKLVASSKGYVDAKGSTIYQPYNEAVMREKVIICKTPGFFIHCKGCRLEGNCPQSAEVQCAIEMDGESIGVIGMVALNEEQRYRLLGKTETLLEFIHEMGQMLVSKIREKEYTEKIEQDKSLIETTLNTVNDGIITFDNNGIVTHTNDVACQLLRVDKLHLVGKPFDQFLTGGSILRFIRAGTTIQHQEHIFPGTPPIHCLLSLKPIYSRKKITGAVLSISDIHDVRSVVNEWTGMADKTTFDAITGESDQIVELKQQALKIAQSDSTVIIQGESGTGKEIFARAIHSASARSKGPFAAINCAAIPEMLLESELFGYEHGAFSGAKRGGKPGKFELADGGTLFLDEIGDMPLHLQVKLLRVLQERVLERVGGTTAIAFNVRVIAATNQDLENKVRLGEFRNDLFYRLNVIPLFLPPLRERKKDIVVLSKVFLSKYAQKLNKDIIDFSPVALEAFYNYSWPGNIRELENTIEYAINIESGRYISKNSLPKRILQQAPSKTTLREKIREYEMSQITTALNSYGWGSKGKEKAALELGISVPSLYRKLTEMGKTDAEDFKINNQIIINNKSN
ncbi:MAG: sigma-54 interaction domain-containing protein [Negativicutes bacterium]